MKNLFAIGRPRWFRKNPSQRWHYVMAVFGGREDEVMVAVVCGKYILTEPRSRLLGSGNPRKPQRCRSCDRAKRFFER